MNSQYMQSDNSIDVVSAETLNDYELFFGPLEPGIYPLVTEKKMLGDILFELGLCESKTWARKNGWHKEVAGGFHMVQFGKTKVSIYIFIKNK